MRQCIQQYMACCGIELNDNHDNIERINGIVW